MITTLAFSAIHPQTSPKNLPIALQPSQLATIFQIRLISATASLMNFTNPESVPSSGAVNQLITTLALSAIHAQMSPKNLPIAFQPSQFATIFQIRLISAAMSLINFTNPESVPSSCGWNQEITSFPTPQIQFQVSVKKFPISVQPGQPDTAFHAVSIASTTPPSPRLFAQVFTVVFSVFHAFFTQALNGLSVSPAFTVKKLLMFSQICFSCLPTRCSASAGLISASPSKNLPNSAKALIAKSSTGEASFFTRLKIALMTLIPTLITLNTPCRPFCSLLIREFTSLVDPSQVFIFSTRSRNPRVRLNSFLASSFPNTLPKASLIMSPTVFATFISSKNASIRISRPPLMPVRMSFPLSSFVQ